MATNTWKQYGGTRKQNQFHNLTIGTLVADNVLLRESYAGKFIIPGSIYVKTDVNCNGNIYGFINNFTSFDSYVGKNFYLNKRMYFGTQNQILDGDNTHAYMYGDFSANAVGINTQTPKSALDINGINYTQTDILSVSSAAQQIRNTLGKNLNNRGISLTASDNNATLGFYIDTSLNYANSPNAQINHTGGGNMYYISTNNNINSTNNTILTAGGSTFITSQTLTNITSTQSMTISTKNTNILSKVAISNRGQPTNIYNESTIIYDISNGLYLYDAYENSASKAGSAVTLVATDNSSNTFLRLVTPNNAGLSITAGTYPNDQTRTISAFGVADNTGKYRVNQTMVTGSQPTKYYTTTGFNTYAPRTDTYVMDINGPTHISNGEINKMAEFNFEVLKTSFSKTVTTFGITAGTPSPKVTENSVVRNPQYISYTRDGGITWTDVRVDGTGDFEQGTPKNFTVYTHDDTYAFLGSSTSALYYTKNGGLNWVNAIANDPGNNDYIRVYQTLFMNPTKINNKSRLFASLTRTLPRSSTIELCIFYTDLDLNSLPTLPSQIPNGLPSYFLTNFTESVVNSNMTNIYNNDGIGNSLYFVGTGINKYNTTTATSQYLINTSKTYYGIHCYSSTYIVAVGAIIVSNNVTSAVISYTTDGTNWLDSTLPNSIPVAALRSIHLFDTNRGMAVGDSGLFLYTNDGARTWSIIPNSILNSSGYASRINGSYNKLRNVYMIDTNTMAITAVKQSYAINVTNGLSKTYMCYIPNLYNRATNKILDVSGNMEISGDINVNDGGNLVTNNSTFNLINTNATTVNFANAANNIYMGNIQSGKTYLQHDFDVSGNVAMHESLVLDNDFSMNGNIQVDGTGYVGGDLSVNNRLFITQKAVFYDDIHVFGNIEHELDYKYLNRLYVEQDTYLYQRLFVGGDSSLNGNVYIGGPVSITTTITPNSNTITLSSDTPIQSSQSLEVGTSVSCGSIFPAGTIITAIPQIEPIFGHLVVNGIDQVTNQPVTGDILNGNTMTLNNMPQGITVPTTRTVFYQNSKMFSVYPDTSLNSRLYVGGDTSLNGRLAITGDVSLNGNLNMYNSQSYMTLNPTSMTYNYSTTPGFPTYNTLPLSQFQYIQTLTQSVQEVLNTVTSKTGPIGITNTRDFTIPSNNLSRDVTIITSDSSNGDTSTTLIDPTSLGLTDPTLLFGADTTSFVQNTNTVTETNRATTTLLTFDIGANNVLLAGNLIPTTAANINIGLPSLPLGSIYLYNQNALNFMSSNQNGILSQGALSFNMSTGYLDLSYNGLLGSTLLTYGGNVAIGKALPNTTLDVLGTSTFNGNITQQTGNLYLNNQLFVASDISLAGNMYSNKNLYQLGDAIISSRTFFLGDVSVNSNLFILKDASLNSRLYLGGDASFSSSLYVAKNLNLAGDISLNSRLNIRGDASFNSNLYVANRTFLNNDLSLNGNIVVNGFAYFNRDEYLQGNLFVTGNQFLNGNILLNGTTTAVSDVNINSRLYLAKDASFNARLFLQDTANFNSDVFLNRNAYISNDLSLNGNLSIGGRRMILNGDASMNGNLTLRNNLIVNADTSLNGNMIINGIAINRADVFMNNRAFITNDASLSANLFVNSNFTLVGDASMGGNVNLSGVLNNKGDVNVNSRLFVNNDTSLNSNLYVRGFSILNNDTLMNGNLSVSNSLIRTNAYVNNNLIVLNDASFNANLIVGRNVVINGTANINGALTVNNINNTGSITTTGTSTTYGNVNVGSNLNVSQNTNLNGALNVASNANIIGNLNVVSDLSVNGSLYVANYPTGSIPLGAIYGGAGLGLGSFANDVNIGKNFYVGGDTILYGNLTVVKNTMLIGQLVIKQYTVNQVITTVSYQLMIAEDLSLNGRFYMTGDASINGRVFIGQDVSMNANLYVGGKTTFAQPITIGNSLSINGPTVQNGQVTNNTLTIFNADASMNARLSVFGPSNFNSDVSMNNRLYVQNDTSLNGNFYVKGQTILQGDASLNTRLFVQNDTSLNSNFYVKGQTILQGDASLNNRLFVQNDTSLNGNFYVKGQTILQGDASLNTRLFVQNDTNLFSRLIVQGQSIFNNDTSMNNRLYVAKDASFGSNLYVTSLTTLNSDVSMNRRLYVQGDVSLGSNLYVANRSIQVGDVSMNSRLFVGGDASLNGNVYVGGKTIHQNDVSFNKMIFGVDASYTGNVAIYGNLYLQTDLKFDSLYVKQPFTAADNVYITGQSTQMVDASLNGNLNVNMDSSLNGRLYLARDASFSGRLFVAGDVSINGNVFATTQASSDNSTKVATTAFVKTAVGALTGSSAGFTGDVSVNYRLYVGADASLQGKLFTVGDISANSRLFVGSDVSIGGNLFVQSRTIQGGDISANSRLFVGSDVSLAARLFIGGDLSVNGNVNMNGNVTAPTVASSDNSQKVATTAFVKTALNSLTGSSAAFAGDVSINYRLYVGTDTSMGGRLFVAGDVSLNGNVFATTQASSDNSTKLATTAFVKSALTSLTGSSAAFTGDVSINYRLYVGSDASMSSKLFIGGDVSMNSRLFVGSDASMGGNLRVNSMLSFAPGASIVNTTANVFQPTLLANSSYNYTAIPGSGNYYFPGQNYASTDYTGQYFFDGLHLSTDYGATSSIPSIIKTYNDAGNGLVDSFVTRTGQIMISSGFSKVFISRDYGSTWSVLLDQAVQTWWSGWFHGKVVCDSTGTYIFARSATTNSPLYVSNNSGSTWTKITSCTGPVDMSNMNNTNRGSIYCNLTGQYAIATGLNGDGGTGYGYVTSNYGVSWISVSLGTSANYYGFEPWMSESGQYVWLAGNFSSNYGVSFARSPALPNGYNYYNSNTAQQFAASADASIILVYGGPSDNWIKYSTDYGATVTQVNTTSPALVNNVLSGDGKYNYRSAYINNSAGADNIKKALISGVISSGLSVSTSTTVQGSSVVSQDISMGGRLFTSGDVSLNSRLYLGSDASMGGNLYTRGIIFQF